MRRTYYFGVRYATTAAVVGDTTDEEAEEELEKLSGSALRNMTHDVEKLTDAIPGALKIGPFWQEKIRAKFQSQKCASVIFDCMVISVSCIV